MKKKIQMSLDDIVFEHRNKAYGAYALRQEYRANLTKATTIGSLLVSIIFLSSFVFHKMNPPKKRETGKYYEHKTTEPPIVVPDLEEPPVKEQKKQQVVKQVKFIPQIVPVEDKKPENEDDIPTEEEIEDAVIGNERVEGPPPVGSFVNPGPVEISGDLTAPVPPAPPAPKIDEALVISEIMPEFEGGMSKMYKWLGKNLKYPDVASRNGIEGRVVISFIVEKNGRISDVKILKGIGFGCDEEAERVIKAMPKWKAGMQNGSPVRVKYTLPLTFKIN